MTRGLSWVGAETCSLAKPLLALRGAGVGRERGPPAPRSIPQVGQSAHTPGHGCLPAAVAHPRAGGPRTRDMRMAAADGGGNTAEGFAGAAGARVTSPVTAQAAQPGAPHKVPVSRVHGDVLMSRLSFLWAAPLTDACFGDDVTTGPGDPPPPHTSPTRQTGFLKSQPPLRKRAPLTQGMGSGQESSLQTGRPRSGPLQGWLCTPNHLNTPEPRAAAEPPPSRGPRPLLARLSQSRGFPKLPQPHPLG